MEYAGIRDVIKEIHGPNATIVRNGPWVTTRCPLAPWTHARGTDRSPSFGVLENANGKSIFNCFTCKKKGTIPMLWGMLGQLDGNDYSEHIDDAESAEILGPKLPAWGSTSKVGRRDKLADPLPEEVSLVYEPAHESSPARRYLKKRRIVRGTSEALGLLYDPDDGHGQDRILFPVRNPAGNLFGYTGRAIDPDVEPRIRDYYGLDKRLLLLGTQNCRDLRASGGSPIVLVEGLFDYAKVCQAGYESVAGMGSGLTPAQLSILKRLGRSLVLMYDNDKAGREGASQVSEALRDHLTLFWVRYPKPNRRKIAEDPEWAKHHSDPGSLTKSQIRKMIETRRLVI